MSDLPSAHRYTTHNRAQIEAGKLCGCCSCAQIFPREEVLAWTGLEINNTDDPEAVNRQTAPCPRCGVEAVLGDQSGFPIDTGFLVRMSEAWFQPTVIRRAAPSRWPKLASEWDWSRVRDEVLPSGAGCVS
jgi:hypothetical protein